ncbi:acetyl/propionyl/methylcrotonyl-CoA carboxylase subunit alpha [Roseovarius sp. Pro17]|uniref:acetyl/propionyl/methylcrotonyl-CoA carboxylase subunit alpha n=1 Tax=Roseovarius sp. Pro17 TaxID=3108175 RepID=UPI002D78A5B4|nr:acetyl/propionyl/methylcrotonyl-CoA carboxylase subunit alpha [Roseovarius sp. Pro17]
MFSKILIANRGEIACRVIATARRMGVRTVAVYSDADVGAKHVAMADEAVRIGPPPVAESYLLSERIIEAALATGAQAIHPGYGFLSENPDFVDAVAAAGLVFIGPTASAIRAMGLKDAAKDLMAKANVPVVPGYTGADQDPVVMAQEAARIGYPVMIKARAGGGGKGMRLVQQAQDFAVALEGARREGQANFGDPVCLIEKYIQSPRHIEMQVFGDSHGNVVHLFERDCSLQRRHQKVIEEAPAPGMTDAVRGAMGAAAVEAARAIGYQGAGTVEFIVDGSGGLRTDGFWFMEMNTRLQVEHPVSEAITGLDFVELQLRVAAGEPLPVTQDDLTMTGHAFEARIYAEDVARGFRPATGVLQHLDFPAGLTFARSSVRVDSGVRRGDEIGPWYDPMIAKLIVHGPTRDAALRQLRNALADCHVAGSVTNLEFLHALADEPSFVAGQMDTTLIERQLETLIAQAEVSPCVTGLAAVVAAGLLDKHGAGPWSNLSGWRHWGSAQEYVQLMLDDEVLDLSITHCGDGVFAIGDAELSIKRCGDTAYGVTQNGLQRQMHAVVTGSDITVFEGGRTHRYSRIDPLLAAQHTGADSDSIVAPMPGSVTQVSAVAGTSVVKDTPLIVLEAMKMEHTLRAPRDGVIAEVLVARGDQVIDGQVLLALVSEE